MFLIQAYQQVKRENNTEEEKNWLLMAYGSANNQDKNSLN